MRCWSWLAFGLWLGAYPERIFSPSDALNDTSPDGISMNDQPSLEGIVKRFVAGVSTAIEQKVALRKFIRVLAVLRADQPYELRDVNGTALRRSPTTRSWRSV